MLYGANEVKDCDQSGDLKTIVAAATASVSTGDLRALVDRLNPSLPEPTGEMTERDRLNKVIEVACSNAWGTRPDRNDDLLRELGLYDWCHPKGVKRPE